MASFSGQCLAAGDAALAQPRVPPWIPSGRIREFAGAFVGGARIRPNQTVGRLVLLTPRLKSPPSFRTKFFPSALLRPPHPYSNKEHKDPRGKVGGWSTESRTHSRPCTVVATKFVLTVIQSAIRKSPTAAKPNDSSQAKKCSAIDCISAQAFLIMAEIPSAAPPTLNRW